MAWFQNIHPIMSDLEQELIAFDDIGSMTIERYYNNYLNSNGDS